MRNKEFNPGPQAQEMRNYFDSRHIKYKDIAERLGVTPGSVSNMLAGRDPIGRTRARQLADTYGFDYIYLLTGEGTLLGTPHFQSVGDLQAGAVNIQAVDSQVDAHGICPSQAELLQRLESLKASIREKDETIKRKEEEVSWLRDMVDRLLPGRNLQFPCKDSND